MISSRLGRVRLSRRILARAKNPGVQNPHWTAPLATNARPSVRRRLSGKPSMVIMRAPLTFCMGVIQASAGPAFISTRQAPQVASPLQPSFTDTIPSTSLK